MLNFLNAKRTKRLEKEIINISMNLSSTVASKILSENVANISKSTICELLKKRDTIIDKNKITKVCIDNFAIKKRNKYGTIMIDLETHRVTYLINSRDLNDVKEWLKTYKNLQLVSRDGSIVYKKAITLSHPLAIQVSDRFHMLKNLTDYCKEYLKNKFDNKVVIEEKVVIN